VIEGGTPVTLIGNNLGYLANHTHVTIAGAICTPLHDKYVVSTRSDCSTDFIVYLEQNSS